MEEYKKIISHLGLEPHPEGGYYKEIYHSPRRITGSEEFPERASATSIYFLLSSGDVSVFHRLTSDELWYYHSGASLNVYMINQDGNLHVQRLGMDLEKGDLPQVIVPAGTIFGAKLEEENTYSLVGCMVTPGFDFADFEMLSREELLKKFPIHQKIIWELTKE